MILSFDPTGRLVDVSHTDSVDSVAGVEFFNGILIPGMVNAHCHSELSYLRGKIPSGGGLSGFIAGISAVRETRSIQERQEAFSFWDAKMYHQGVTAVGDICNSSLTFEQKRNSPIHYHNFIERFGLSTTDFSSSEQVETEAHALGLAASPTPHSTYSLQDRPFREVCNLGNPLSIHFMESAAEEELFHQKGALHDRYRQLGVEIDFAHYGSPAQRIVASVATSKNLLLIHNTFATEEAIRPMINHAYKQVTWVVCPGSNLYIENQLPPVDLFRRMGLRIAVGTDSLASNHSLAMVEEMKLLQPYAPLEEILSWVTLRGAEALDIDPWAGSFEAGKRPGAVLLTGIDWGTLSLTPESQTKRIL